MKKLALLLANVLAVVGLAVLTIKLFPVPRLNQNQTAWLIDASGFFHFNDTEWFGALVLARFICWLGVWNGSLSARFSAGELRAPPLTLITVPPPSPPGYSAG